MKTKIALISLTCSCLVVLLLGVSLNRSSPVVEAADAGPAAPAASAPAAISAAISASGMEPGAAPDTVPVAAAKPERACLDCHRYANINTNEGVLASRAQCLECHAKDACVRKTDGVEVSLQVTPGDFEIYPHQWVACIQCHDDVARSPHKTETGARCDQCHTVHGEKTAGDPHLRSACQTCHFKAEFMTFDADAQQIRLARKDDKGRPLAITDHRLADAGAEETCKRCHTPDNRVGAPGAVLPTKSALCILCHSAPLAVGHPLFGLAILIFIAGVVLTLRFWYLGSVQGEETSLHRKIDLSAEAVYGTIFSRKFFSLVKVFFLDIVLQRNILRQSVRRWSMHSLIYLGILVRLALGLFTSIRFRLDPESGLALALIDKNHPFTAFMYDLLGLFILAGIIWAIVQRFVLRPAHVVSEIEDNVALGFIGIIVALGFILEGVRILVTGIPAGTAIWSFVGYPIAQMFSLSEWNWTAVYPYLWYAHALVGASFVAYLPFGKMRHVVDAPLTYFLESVSGVKREKRV